MPSTNLATYRTEICDKLGLNTTDDSAKIDRWLNQGYDDFVRRTRCVVNKATMSLTSGVSDYTLDTAILSIVTVTITNGTSTWNLEPASLEEILNLRTSALATSQPVRFYAQMGYNSIAVWPTPGTGSSMTVYYVPRPTSLSATADAPTLIPYEFHKALEFYALAEGADYDNVEKPPGGSNYYFGRYLELVRECIRGKHAHGNRRMSPAVVRSRAGRTATKNDTYPRF